MPLDSSVRLYKVKCPVCKAVMDDEVSRNTKGQVTQKRISCNTCDTRGIVENYMGKATYYFEAKAD